MFAEENCLLCPLQKLPTGEKKKKITKMSPFSLLACGTKKCFSPDYSFFFRAFVGDLLTFPLLPFFIPFGSLSINMHFVRSFLHIFGGCHANGGFPPKKGTRNESKIRLKLASLAHLLNSRKRIGGKSCAMTNEKLGRGRSFVSAA